MPLELLPRRNKVNTQAGWPDKGIDMASPTTAAHAGWLATKSSGSTGQVQIVINRREPKPPE